MKKSSLFHILAGAVCLFASTVTMATSGVYAGGPVYNARNYSINELKTSGFTNLVVWTIHVESDGSLGFNGEFPLVANGAYIGAATYPDFQADIASLKGGTSSIARLEFGLSAAGSGTYANVRNLLQCSQNHCGTGPSSILYRNFQALKATFPTVDALNNDDESTYHVSSAAPFHIMLADIGFKTAIVPYTNKSFWQAFVSQVNSARPGSVDALYLQAYAGGSGNNPCSWNLGLPVYPGLWSRDDTPAQVQSQMQSWKNSCSTVTQGGFMWLYDDFDNGPRVAQYATAINNVFSSTTPPPTGVASVYPDCSFAGTQAQLAPGSYTLSQLQALGISNDGISSLKVDSGYQMTLYQHDNFGGFSWTAQSNDSCLNNNSDGPTSGTWDNDISSLVVAQITTTPNNQLQKGVAKTGLSGSQGTELRFTFTVPAGVTGVTISINGGSGDVDLYVNKNTPPTVAAASTNDCRPYRNGNNETCSTQLSPYTSGTYHVMLHGYQSFSGVSLTADYSQ